MLDPSERKSDFLKGIIKNIPPRRSLFKRVKNKWTVTDKVDVKTFYENDLYSKKIFKLK